MPPHSRLALFAAALLAASAYPALAQPPIPQPDVPPPVVNPESVPNPTVTGLIGRGLQAAIEGARLGWQPDPVAVFPAPPVAFGGGGVRINVPGVRINVPGVQIGPEPPAVVAGPSPRNRLAELSRRSWESSDRLFATAARAARDDEGRNRLLASARQYADALRSLANEPRLNVAEFADVARLNHAVLGMLDAIALQRLADDADGPNGPPTAELRQMSAALAAESLDAARLGQDVVIARPDGRIPAPPNVRPALVLLAGSARDLLARLNDDDPTLPRATTPLTPPAANDLEPIP